MTERHCPSCEGDRAYYIVGEAGDIYPASKLPDDERREVELIDPCDHCKGAGYLPGAYDQPTREDVEGYR